MEKTDIKSSVHGDGLQSKAASEFMKIMGTTLDLNPEQVRAALDRFQNIHMEGEPIPGLAPFIDPAGEQGNPRDLLALFLGRKPDSEAPTVLEDEDGIDDDEHCEGCGVIELAPEDLKENGTPAVSPAQAIRAVVAADIGKVSEVTPDPVLDSPGMKKGKGGDMRNPEIVKPMPQAPETFGQEVASQAKARSHDAPRTAQVPLQETVGTEAAKPVSGSVDSPMPAADKEGWAEKTKLAAKPTADPSSQAKAGADSAASQTPRSESTVAAAFAAANAKSSASNRPMTATPKKTAPTTAPLAASGLTTVVEETKPAMGEALKVEPDAPKVGVNGLVNETENGMTENKAGEGETVQRAPAGRQGFQSVISRIESHAGRTTEAEAADKSMAEPSREMKSDIMRQIVQRMTLRTQGDQSRMQIQLKPEFLGNVHLQITTENQQVAVRMMAESTAVKEMIEQHLSFLKSELQQHGLEIDKFDVQVGGDREGWKNSQDPSGFRQALKEGQQGRQGRKRKAQREEAQSQGTEKVVSEQKRQTSEIDYFA